jgi:hypothetical protein
MRATQNNQKTLKSTKTSFTASNVNKNSLDVENMPTVLADTDTAQIEVITNVSANSENTLEHASSTETASNEGTNTQGKTDPECQNNSIKHPRILKHPLSQKINVSTAPGTTSDEPTSTKMPQKIKKRGRPKGSNPTTIGPPKRKKANITPLSNMPFQNKQKKILSWFAGEEAAAPGPDGSIHTEEESTETRPETTPHPAPHENVDTNPARQEQIPK